MGLAVLHVHTVYSWDGTCTVSAVLKQATQQANLDVIAITDHDEIDEALEALDLARIYGIEVILGCVFAYISRRAGWIQANTSTGTPITLCRWDQVQPTAASLFVSRELCYGS
jgi:DNA polymerase III alpha subunit